MWGKAGAGDRIVRIEDGKVIKGFESVGPGKENHMTMPSFDLDEHVDPSTGDLLDSCIGPQCKPASTIDLSKILDLSDKEGEPANGTAVFGGAIPPDPDMDVSDRIAWARAHKPAEENGGEGFSEMFHPSIPFCAKTPLHTLFIFLMSHPTAVARPRP